MTGQPNVEMICPDCGSDDVGVEATMSWNSGKQCWVTASIGEDYFCRACDAEGFEPDEVEII